MARISGGPTPPEGPNVLRRGLETVELPDGAGIFVRSVHDYAHHRGNGPICLLEAGCGRPAETLGVDRLRTAGFEIRVTGVDHDDPLTRAVSGARSDLDSVTLGDLRTVALTPRSFDIVHCAGLLERVSHAELVLDRFVAALKPGGILLLRLADRDSATGVTDRVAATVPGRMRELAWRQLRPGEPGPYPAVYEPIVSGPGIQGYALMRGLTIAHRQALVRTVARPGIAARTFLAARRFAAGVSHGRYTDQHDELLFVLRRPEDRFARVL